MGSDEAHEDIPAASAEENENEDLKNQAATEEEPEIPQPEEHEIAIPEVLMQLTDTPLPKLKDPFSRKQKFKTDAFFGEHVFFTDYNPYDSARIRKRHFWTASQANFYSSVLFNKDKVFDHEHIPHVDMESLSCFVPVLRVLHDAGLLNFCTHICDWNEELTLLGKGLQIGLILMAHRGSSAPLLYTNGAPVCDTPLVWKTLMAHRKQGAPLV